MDISSRSDSPENWAQFELRDPATEAAELSALEASFQLRRGWNADGAANVYFRGKSTLWAVGQDVVQCHRFRHRRWAGKACAKACVARDLYAFCLLCLPTDLNPRTMPIARLTGPLIAKALDFNFASTMSFHREVTRDLSHLRTTLAKPTRERSPVERSLVTRYAAMAAVLRARPHAGTLDSIIGQSENFDKFETSWRTEY
jgi:hypothetical protein